MKKINKFESSWETIRKLQHSRKGTLQILKTIKDLATKAQKRILYEYELENDAINEMKDEVVNGKT